MPTPRKKPAGDKPAAPKKAAAPRKAAAKKAPAADAAGADVPDYTVPRGNYDLVVVESPAKAKTINKYLGPNFRVLASYGHVRDLDTHKKKGEAVAGIDITNGWKLRYTVDDGSKDEPRGGRKFRSAKDILAEIGREAARANMCTSPATPTAKASRSRGTSPTR